MRNINMSWDINVLVEDKMKIFVKFIGIIAVLTIMISAFSVRCFSEELLNWEISFGINSQNAIAANDNVCVCVGTDGVIFITEDGLNWNKEKTITNRNLNDIVWTGKEFIAVGDHGLIIASVDGKNWAERKSGTSIDLEGIVGNSEVLISYGDSKISVSKDGVSWVEKELGIGIESIVLNNGRFIALNSKLEGITSIDGVDWSKYTTFPEKLHNSYGLFTSFKGNFVITSSFGTGSKEIYTSKDGMTWDTIEVPDLSYMIASEINATEDFLLLSGRYSVIAYTENITDWTRTNLGNMLNDSSRIDEEIIKDMVFFKGQYIGIMLGMTTENCFIISKDSKSWQKVSAQTSSFILNSIASDGTSYISAVPKDIIKVLVNERPILFDVAPVLSNNRILVPARYIFEALKAEVNWDDKSKEVIIKGEDKEVRLSINNTTAYVNNVEVQLDVAPIIINGRTLIPLRFVAESFNTEVNWNKDTQTVSINALN